MANPIVPRPWLRDLCEASGLTQVQIAEKAGISVQALWLFIVGQRTPSLQAAIKLGDLLDFDPRRFLESA